MARMTGMTGVTGMDGLAESGRRRVGVDTFRNMRVVRVVVIIMDEHRTPNSAEIVRIIRTPSTMERTGRMRRDVLFAGVSVVLV